MAMILGLAGVAFAFSDTPGTANEKAIAKLAALKILDGYPDGSFKPENPITRAEFAAVIVRALGYASSANLLKTNPVFPDCKNAEWAWGYINVAAAQGIIKGYTDGTFGPGKNVSIAEAVTMIVRALGMDAKALGTWPMGHIMVASELGILPNDLPAVNVPATRANVSQLVGNSLNVPFQYKNSEGVWVAQANQSFLARNSASAVSPTVVSSVSGATFIATDSKKYTLAEGATLAGFSTLAGFVGHRVDLLLNKAEEVIYIGSSTVGVTGVITAVDLVNKTVTVGGVVYTVNDNAAVQINAQPKLGDAVAKITGLKGADVSLVLDNKGKVTSIVGTLLGSAVTITGKVTKYEAAGTVNYLTLKDVTGEKKVASSATIKRNGVDVTYADLQIGDSVRVAYSDVGLTTLSYIDASRNEIKGILQEKSVTDNHATYKVNDVIYHVALNANGTDVTTGDEGVKAGDAVILTLNLDGNITAVARQTSASKTATLQAKNESWTSTGTIQTLTLSDGSIITIKSDGGGCAFVRNGITGKQFADLKTGDTLVITYDSGKASEVKAYAPISGKVVAEPTATDGVGVVEITDGTATVAKVPFKFNYSSLQKNGIQTIVSSVDEFEANTEIKVLSWNFSTPTAPYGNFLTRSTNQTGYVFKGIQASLVDGTLKSYLVLREGSADSFIEVTPGAILHRADVAVSETGLVVGDKVAFQTITEGGHDGTSLDKAWKVSYLTATGDSTAPTVTKQADDVDGLSVKYNANEAHIASYTVYNYNSGVKVFSGPSAEMASGNSTITWEGKDDSGVVAPAGFYTVVLSVKDYAGNTATPLVFTVTVTAP